MLTSDRYRYGIDQGTRASQPNHLGRRGSDLRPHRDLVAISLDGRYVEVEDGSRWVVSGAAGWCVREFYSIPVTRGDGPLRGSNSAISF